MPKRTNKKTETCASTPGKKRKFKVPVRVDVTYLGHVFVEAIDKESAADIVFDRKDQTLIDLGDTVYHTESKSYIEGDGIPL